MPLPTSSLIAIIVVLEYLASNLFSSFQKYKHISLLGNSGRIQAGLLELQIQIGNAPPRASRSQ
jgi:hypothetical protein